MNVLPEPVTPKRVCSFIPSFIPSAKELNEEGIDGWELIHVHKFKKEFFDCDLEYYYSKEVYNVTFKREII